MLMLLACGVLLQEISTSIHENFADASNIPELPLFNYENINLPEEHIPYFLYNNQHIATACKQDPHCPYKVRTPL